MQPAYINVAQSQSSSTGPAGPTPTMNNGWQPMADNRPSTAFLEPAASSSSSSNDVAGAVLAHSTVANESAEVAAAAIAAEPQVPAADVLAELQEIKNHLLATLERLTVIEATLRRSI